MVNFIFNLFSIIILIFTFISQHSISKWWNKEQTQTIELVGEAALGGLAGSISGGFGKVGEVIILTTCKKEISKFAVRVTVRTTGKVVATTTTSLIKNGTVTREELVESALSGAVLGAGTHLFHLYHDIPSHDSPPEDFPRELCHNKLPESHLLHTTDQIYNEDIHFKNIETYADIPTSFTNSTRESTRSIDDKKADMNIISEDQVQLMKKTI